MLFTIGIVLIALWLLGLLVFTLTTGAIHFLLVLGIIAVVVHFVRRKTPPPASF